MAYSDWEPIIGLEIHVQLSTLSKLFSGESTKFGAGDNEQTSPVSLGWPGALPVVNKKAVHMAIKIGVALNCTINARSIFVRKNYFYPDMPRGYQISQLDVPICGAGYIEFMSAGKLIKVAIERAHLEEDAGKSTHHGTYSLINLNRSGVPLLEIVSDPVMTSPLQAADYARSMRSIVRYLDVCDGNMEEGSLRCDCNISMRKKGTTALGTKVEIKNVNSFRFVEKALAFEIDRQIDCLETGERIIQETRLYDATKNKTFSMRKKEEANDYRYFPDPDILPLEVAAEWIQTLRNENPELPTPRAQRFQNEYKLTSEESYFLAEEKELGDFFEASLEFHTSPKMSAHWIMGDLTRLLNENKISISSSPVTSGFLGKIIALIEGKEISGKIAKKLLNEVWQTGDTPEAIVERNGWAQVSDPALIDSIIKKLLVQFPDQVEDYRQGKTKVVGFFVGKIMQETGGQADPAIVNKLLMAALKQ